MRKKFSTRVLWRSGLFLLGVLGLSPLFVNVSIVVPSTMIEALHMAVPFPGEVVEYAVWTYPFHPPMDWPFKDAGRDAGELRYLWCAYPSVCVQWMQTNPARIRIGRVEALRLQSLPMTMSSKKFIAGHAYYKVIQGLDFLDHVQSVAVCALLESHPRNKLVDAKLHTSTRESCRTYDPTQWNGAPLMRYPFPNDYKRRYRVVGLSGISKVAQLTMGLQQLALSRFLPYFDTSVNMEDDQSLVKMQFGNETSDFKLEKFLMIQSTSGSSKLESPINIFHGRIEEMPAPNDSTTLVVSSFSKIAGGPTVSHFSINALDFSGRGLLLASRELLEKIHRAGQVVTDHESVAVVALGMGRKACYVTSQDTCNGSKKCEQLTVNGETLWCATLPLGNVHNIDRHRATVWGQISQGGQDDLIVEGAEFFGVVPIRRLGHGVPFTSFPVHDLFHFVFTTKTSSLTWKVLRSFESVFFHHPNADVIVHANHLDSKLLRHFSHMGYNLTVQKYDPCFLLKKTDIPSSVKDRFCGKIKEFSTGRFWYSNESNLMRKLLLYIFGGAYFDTDVYSLRSLPRNLTNVLGHQDKTHVNGAVLLFQPKHPFLYAALIKFMNQYKQALTNWGDFGPHLLTKVLKNNPDIKEKLTLLPPNAFQPIPWNAIHACFRSQTSYNISSSYAIHLNTYFTKDYNKTKRGTLCNTVMNENCVFCNEH